MDTTSQDPTFEPLKANRRAFLHLRWLIVILAGYLTLFENIEEEGIVGIFLVVVAFVLSNVLMALAPLHLVMAAKKKRIVAAVDAIFISIFLYYLRIEQAQIHLPFIGVVVLAIIWPDLRVVLFAMFVVSLLFGIFTNLEIFGAAIDVRRDDFLTMSMLFVVSIFYIFMVERFERDAETSAELLREKRNSELVNEITRRISSSLEAKEIRAILLKRFRELIPDSELSILKIEPGRDEAFVVEGSRPDNSKVVTFERAPAVAEAFTLKESSVATLERDGGVAVSLAVPMISRDAIVSLLYFERGVNGTQALEQNKSLIELVAGTAASALSNAEQYEEMKDLATSDSMTRLANHATFQTRLSQEVERSKRHNRTLSLLMIDLDYLKKINDEFGHPAGDRVIAAVSDAIRSSCREIDIGARYGGEEFALILPETDLRAAVQVGERLRARIEAIDHLTAPVTVSIGVANCPLDAASPQDLVLAADNALYAAKGAGRNRVSPSLDQVANS